MFEANLEIFITDVSLTHSEYQFHSRPYTFNKFKFKISDVKLLITMV